MGNRNKKKSNKTVMPALVVGFLAVGALAVWYSMPNAPAGNRMIPVDTSSIAKGDPIVKVSVPTELSSEAQIGKRAFEAKCATCHGRNAAGRSGFAPPFVHKIYKPSHHGDTAFVMAAKNGVIAHHWTFGNMPPVKGVTDAEVKYIARYIREVQRANGIN